MRITIRSATIIAVLSGARHASADKKDEVTSAIFANSVKSLHLDVAQSYELSNLRRAGKLSFAGKECNTFDNNNTADNDKQQPSIDLGILGCGEEEACRADGTSSLGGRCAAASSANSSASTKARQRPKTPEIPAFKRRRHRTLHRKDRLLQGQGKKNDREEQQDRQIGSGPNVGSDGDEVDDVPFVCPANCPQDFCDCAQDDGDAGVCAPELHSVCIQNLLPECVPDKYLTFYTETYCPFSACLAVDRRPYEECSCGYYRDYCTVYYNYVESLDKCAISECCAGQPSGSKFTCLPGMEPTASPTVSPTLSFKPSLPPTDTSKPSLSTQPSSSRLPSLLPTKTILPTASTRPTATLTDSPSGEPTLSSSPTTSPTKSPTEIPTSGPTLSPTSSPSGMPTHAPSGMPSSSPTTSSMPSTSIIPSTLPTVTFSPTSTGGPTAAPSASAEPTLPPSLLPTSTQPPSVNPTTPSPTFNPTDSPTKGPTGSPSASPSKAPNTDDPTYSPAYDPTPAPSPNPTMPLPAEGGGPVGQPAGASIGTLASGPGAVDSPPRPNSNAGMAQGNTSWLVISSLCVGVGGASWLFA